VDDASGNGVTLDAGSVTLNDNYIGLNLAGAAAGNGGNGVYVSAASARNFIGLNGSRASGVVANVISGPAGTAPSAMPVTACGSTGHPATRWWAASSSIIRSSITTS